MSQQLTFGGWLRQRRTERGVGRDELSERLGFSLDLLKKIESGERRPSGQIAHLLADYFHIPADERDAFVAFARVGRSAGAAGVVPAEAEHDAGKSGLTAPWRRAFTRQTNLPSSLTPFVGRAEEVRALSEQVTHPKTRLVTLTGAPGIGKTRLALRVASDLVEAFEDGVFLIELAPVFDPDLVLQTMAQTLGLQQADDQPVADLVLEYMRERRMLLVFDNFEQVLDAAPLVVKLLETSPWLKVLVTSREALHAKGERRFPVPPLPLPASGPTPSLRELMTYPSIELFVERSRMSQPDFALSEQNAAAVTRICSALEGLPLAIELAAGHSGFFSPHEIEKQLKSPLQLLRTKARDLPDRQRTLRGAIEWSYNLLSAREQAVFRRLGVFVGDYTIEAARAVAGGTDIGTRASDPLDALEALLDKSLITRGLSTNVERSGSTGKAVGQLSMLETLREYAMEQLGALGEEEETRDRHAQYYAAMVREEDEHFVGTEVIGWMERVRAAYNNIREALGWLLEDEKRGEQSNRQERDEGRGDQEEIGRIRLGVNLCATLFPFWDGHHIYLSEARSWYTKAAERIALLAGAENYRVGDAAAIRKASELSPELPVEWAMMLTGVGAMSYYQSDLEEARSLNESGLAIRREIGDKSGVAASLNNLGIAATDQGNYAAARRYLSESLEVARELGIPWKIWAPLNNLGINEIRLGNFDEARALLEEAIEVARKAEMVQKTADALTNLGTVARSRGEYMEARIYLDEALAKYGQLDHRSGIGRALCEFGAVELDVGNFDEARVLYEESLHSLVELGQPSLSFDTLEGLASLAAKQGQPERAARLFGASERLRMVMGRPMSPSERRNHEQHMAAVLQQLGDEQWRTAWAEGQAMPLDQAIAYALDEA